MYVRIARGNESENHEKKWTLSFDDPFPPSSIKMWRLFHDSVSLLSLPPNALVRPEKLFINLMTIYLLPLKNRI